MTKLNDTQLKILSILSEKPDDILTYSEIRDATQIPTNAINWSIKTPEMLHYVTISTPKERLWRFTGKSHDNFGAKITDAGRAAFNKHKESSFQNS